MSTADNRQRIESGEMTPGEEIALMIEEIAERRASERAATGHSFGDHPAEIILNRLKDVDARSKVSARSEVDSLIGQVARTSALRVVPTAPVTEPEMSAPVETKDEAKPTPLFSSHPFAPVRAPTPEPTTWVSDVFEAADAKQKHDDVQATATMAPFATFAVTEAQNAESIPTEDAETTTNIIPMVTAEATASEDTTLDLPSYGRERADEIAARYSDEVEETDSQRGVFAKPAPVVEAEYDVPVREEEEKPSWLLYGVPAAAMVSLVALAFAMESSDNVAVRAVAPATGTTPVTAEPIITAQTPEAAIATPAPVLTAALPERAETPVAETEATDTPPTLFVETTETVPTETVPEVIEVIASVPAAAPAPVETVLPEASVIVPKPAPAPSARVETVVEATPTVPIARSIASVEAAPAIAPASITLIAAPSAKPLASARPRIIARPRQAAFVAPENKVPVRFFSGPIEDGSAADLVSQSAQVAGPALSKTEKFWLARDIERVLESEIDGRSVTVKSRQGQRVRVFLETSKQIERDYTLTRSEEMGALPHGLVLDGGWFVARDDVALNATAAMGSEFRHRRLKQDMLIERLGVFTGRHGDRWYLMGQRGVAVGFVSAADLIPAGASDRPLGLPYHQTQGVLVREDRIVYTRCREGFIGPEGGAAQAMSLCRNAAGHWIDANDGLVTMRTAGLFGALMPAAGGSASSIVLAKATDDPIAYHALANRYFRRRFQGGLNYARAGQVTRQALPDGGDIQFTFGDVYETIAEVPVKRLAAMGALPDGMRVEARWMTAPIGAKLRATPNLMVAGNLGDIPAGAAVEAMGRVESRTGQDWTVVGRKGIAFGYVGTELLTPLAGNVSPMAISAAHTTKAVDLVETVTTCRAVDYETIEMTGSFTACQQLDGNWAVQPEVRSMFADAGATASVAP